MAAGHESFERRPEVRPGSERGFGLVFATVFTVIGLWPLIGGAPIRAWALIVAAAFLCLALVLPRALAPANRLWFRFGHLLHQVVTPVVMSALFFGAVTPTAFLLRVFGKDSLGLEKDCEAESYWIPREPPGPAPETMKNQF